MKLSTLIEVQRCLRILTDAEKKNPNLETPVYMDCFRAKRDFEAELALIVLPQEVEVTK